MSNSVNRPIPDSVIDNILTNSASLPGELIAEILSRLPVKSLIRFRCVCKSWSSFIKHPYFIKLHLNRSIETNSNLSLILRGSYLYSVDLDTCDNAVELDHPLKTRNYGTEVIGSCNGLICIYNSEECISLWNPYTRKCQKLPFTPIEYPGGFSMCDKIVYGFGYDPITDDYKVVRIVLFWRSDDVLCESEVKVYTLSTNSWRRIRNISFNLSYKRVHGQLANNALHWVATRQVESDILNLVVSFDLRDEEFREVMLPDFMDNNFHMNLGVLGGCLCVLCNFHKVRVEIWVMKEHGMRESWCKQYSIEQPAVIRSFEYLRPLCYAEKDEVLLEQDNNKLVWYNPTSERVRNLKIEGIPNRFEAEICIGSLVPLNDDYKVGEVEEDEEEDDNDTEDEDINFDDYVYGYESDDVYDDEYEFGGDNDDILGQNEEGLIWMLRMLGWQ